MSDTRYDRLIVELDAIDTNMGIYPTAIKGQGEEKDYEQRDGYRNGWNACVLDYGEKISGAIERAREGWSADRRLFAADDDTFCLFPDGRWAAQLSDTWYFACADCEPIPEDQEEAVAGWYRRFGRAGVLYWVYLKRGHLPTIARTAKLVELVRGFVEPKGETV